MTVVSLHVIKSLTSAGVHDILVPTVLLVLKWRDQKKRRLWRRECPPIGFWILTIFFILTTWLLDNVPLLYEESRRWSVLEVYGLMLIDHTKTIDDWERIYKAIFTRKSLSCYTNYHDWIMLTSNCKYPTIWQIINSY